MRGGCRVAGRATHVGEHCVRFKVVVAVPGLGEQHVARLDVTVQLDRLALVRVRARLRA